MEIYDFTVAPGKVATINAEGSFCYFISGSAGGADATISLRHDASGDRSLLLPGQGTGLDDGVIGRTWYVSNYAGQAPIVGKLLIGGTGAKFTDNRISGSVEVIDGGKARSMAGSAFITATTGSGSGPGVSPYAQLFNPAASGKNLFLEAFVGSGGAAGYAALHRYDVAGPWALGPAGSPKNLGSTAASVAEVRTGTSGVLVMGTQLVAGYFTSNGQYVHNFKEPLVIAPGKGVIIRGVPSGDITGTFEWFEEAV